MNAIVQPHPARAAKGKRHLEQERDKLIARLQVANRVMHDKDANTALSERLPLVKQRAAQRWSRTTLALVMNASDRAIFIWEQGAPMSPVYAAKLREIQSVYNALRQLMKPEEIGPWLLSELEEFDGLSPADLLSKGETGRLWASLFYLRSGMPE